MKVNIKKEDVEKIIKVYYDKMYNFNYNVTIYYHDEDDRDPDYISVVLNKTIIKNDIKIDFTEEVPDNKLIEIFEDFLGEDYKVNYYHVDHNFITEGYGFGECHKKDFDGITLDVKEKNKYCVYER